MASSSLIAPLQSIPAGLFPRCEDVRLTARDSSFLERPRRISAIYGRDSTIASIGLFPPHPVVCSTSSHSRDSSIRRRSRSSPSLSPSPNRNTSGSSKPVSILPGDLKLLRDLQDFISASDLPPHQVPSTRELVRRGRQDLANAVRRRGEKALSQLLSNPNYLSSGTTTKQCKSKSRSGTPSLEVDDALIRASKLEVVPSPSFRPPLSTDTRQTTDLVPQSSTGLLLPDCEDSVESRPAKFSNQNDCATSENPIEVTILGSSSTNNDGGKQALPKTLGVAKSSQATVSYGGDCDDEENTQLYSCDDFSHDDTNDDAWSKQESIKSFEESLESNAWQNASILKSNLIAFFDKSVGKSVTQPRTDSEAVFDIMAKQRESERFLRRGQQYKDQPTAGVDPAAEIAGLSALLHGKEMETLKVSRELEEAKAMLALVRAKHSGELAQAKQVAIEQDLRLHAAEQALHSLKLIHVDWWGEGNRVELAGSFNGWQHHAYLLPDLSSKTSKLPGSRGALLWRIDLWLYPGVYEIKFIVDGKWVLDNRREVVQGHMGENNLLYVEP